ncbi:MAG: TetR/AcrR family transcriptional regulator [Actinomycetota bacterium]|nr:TetR/AcrR family transcriptional regulator [Actinomycetota bacterium]
MAGAAATRGQQVRRQLLAAAAELIPQLGWSAVSTRTLAQRAGVTPSVVHYHFPSLQAVLQEAALGAMRRATAELEASLSSAGPQELIDSALAAMRPYTGADPTTVLFVEAYLAGLRDQHFGAAIADLLTHSRGRLAQRLAEDDVADPDGTAAVVFAALDGLVLHRGLGVGPDPARATALRRIVAAGGAR